MRELPVQPEGGMGWWEGKGEVRESQGETGCVFVFSGPEEGGGGGGSGGRQDVVNCLR